MKDRSNEPSHHWRTLLPRSYISLLTRLRQCGTLQTWKLAKQINILFNGTHNTFYSPFRVKYILGMFPDCATRCTTLSGYKTASSHVRHRKYRQYYIDDKWKYSLWSSVQMVKAHSRYSKQDSLSSLNTKGFMRFITARLRDQYLQAWNEDLNSYPKCTTYRIFKTETVITGDHFYI